MAFNLKEISKIRQERQATILGYIRAYEKVNNTIIPKGIVLMVILFYGNDTDKWDPQCISNGMILSNLDRTITKTSGSFESSYCAKIIESGIFKWKFKIEHRYGPIIVGIWKDKDDSSSPPLNTLFTKKNFGCGGYGFCSWTGAFLIEEDSKGGIMGKTYGVILNKGAIIEMILDLEQLTLSYIIDGKDYGKAFDVEKCKYRAAVCMYNKENAITLLQ